MREHPWHIRRPTAGHYQWFLNLVDLHSITTAWFKDLDLEQNVLPHQLKRVLSPGIQENLAVLEKLTESSLKGKLESILDESLPEEMLTKLEHTVWAVQAWSLQGILDRTAKNEVQAVRNALEQSSWKSGRNCFEKRWPKAPAHARQDLRGVLASFQNSPLSNYPHQGAFLIRRAIRDEVQVELFACPHQNPFVEVRQIADLLCQLHTHWMRGFAYGMNTRVIVDYHPLEDNKPSARCHVHWRFHPVV